MADLRCLTPVMIALGCALISHALAICGHYDVRCFGRGCADWRGTEHQRQGQNHEAQSLHAARRLRRIGQRMTSKIVPASPMTRPPMAKVRSHHVLKFSWFFQSMM